MEDHKAIEKELLKVIDDVIGEFEPVLKADDIFIDRSVPIYQPYAAPGYASEVAISFYKLKKDGDKDAMSIGHIFDVLLFLKGKAENADRVRQTVVSEFEGFIENLKNGKIHWL